MNVGNTTRTCHAQIARAMSLILNQDTLRDQLLTSDAVLAQLLTNSLCRLVSLDSTNHAKNATPACFLLLLAQYSRSW